MTNVLSVLILYNEPCAAVGGCTESEAGVLDQVHAVEAALGTLGIPSRTVGITSLPQAVSTLSQAPEPVVFNLVETLDASAPAANRIPCLCVALGKVHTGGDTPVMDLTLNKFRAKAVLQAAGLPVPPGVMVPMGADPSTYAIPSGRILIKPACTDASEGIEADKAVFAENGPALWQAVRNLQERFEQPILVENLVGSRELNVAVMQCGDKLEVLPLAEIDFVGFAPDKPRIVDYAAKWLEDTFEYKNTVRILPSPIPEAMAVRVRELARAAWAVTGCADYARVDFRFDNNGDIWILEVNTNPDISPDAGYAAAVGASGRSYADFIKQLMDNAQVRLRALNGVASLA